MDNIYEKFFKKHNDSRREYYTKLFKEKYPNGITCLLCGSQKTYTRRKQGSPHWLKYMDGFICVKCYQKIRYANRKKNLF